MYGFANEIEMTSRMGVLEVFHPMTGSSLGSEAHSECDPKNAGVYRIDYEKRSEHLEI